jgi:hypothetical protein
MGGASYQVRLNGTAFGLRTGTLGGPPIRHSRESGNLVVDGGVSAMACTVVQLAFTRT